MSQEFPYINNMRTRAIQFSKFVIGSLIIGGLGQWILSKPIFLLKILGFHHSGNIILGFSFLIPGALLFGWAIRNFNAVLPYNKPLFSVNNIKKCPDNTKLYFIPIIIVAMSVFFYIMAKLLNNEYQHIISGLFLITLILFALVFAAYDYYQGIKWWKPPKIWDVVFIFFFVTVFIGLNTIDLTDWYYSAIGDEYNYFVRARFLTEGGDFNPFYQNRVWGTHPEMDSVYQAAVMKIFGINHFGWKFSGVLALGLSIPFFYLLVLNLWDRRTAVYASMVLASSHFLYGYVHTGYNTVHAITITIASFWCFFAAYTRRSVLLYFVCGIFASFCFYTFFPARIAPVALALFVLIIYKARPPLRLIIPVLTGGILVLAPFFAVNGMDVFAKMFNYSAMDYDPSIVGDRVSRVVHNIYIHLIAFNYNNHPHHFVWGTLLDPVSAALAVLGLGALFSELGRRNKPVIFIMLWWLLAFIATAIFSPHGYVSMNRINFLVPCYAILAGLAIRYSTVSLERLMIEAKKRQAIQLVILSILFCTIFALNLYRFWYQSPPHVPMALEAVAVKAVRSDECRRNESIAVISGGQTDFLQTILESYPTKPAPKVLPADEFLPNITRESKYTSCIIYIGWLKDIRLKETVIVKALNEDSRNWQHKRITDYGGNRVALVFFPL